MPSTPGTYNFPASLDDAVSLLEVANFARSTLAMGAGAGDATITLVSAALFTDTGVVTLADSLTAPTAIEHCLVTGKSGDTLTVTRGAFGTTAQTWASGAYVQMRVLAEHHEALRDALIQTQTKLGSGASTATSGAFLVGNTTAGTSLWRTLTAADIPDLSATYEPANANIQAHIASTSNPHSVTKAQVGLGNVENTALSTWAGSTSLTTLGTISTGTWNGAVIGASYGGAGTVNGLLKANGSGTVSAAVSGTDYAPATSGSALLSGNGSGGFSNVTIGSGLSFSAGTLSATSSGGASANSTTGVIPYLSAANTFSDSPITRISSTTIQVAAIDGGSAANDDLTLQGTSNATRTSSYVLLQPSGGNVGIGNSTPAARLDIVAEANAVGLNVKGGSGTPAIFQFFSSSGATVALVDSNGNLRYSQNGNMAFSNGGGRGIYFLPNPLTDSIGGSGARIVGNGTVVDFQVSGGCILVTHNDNSLTYPAYDCRLFTSSNTANANGLKMRHQSLGSAGAGFGSNILWQSGNSSATFRDAGEVRVQRVVGTDATRTERMTLSVWDFSAKREILRGESTGTGATIGFLGASAVSRQTVSAAATDAATTQTLVNDLRTALINLGLCV